MAISHSRLRQTTQSTTSTSIEIAKICARFLSGKAVARCVKRKESLRQMLMLTYRDQTSLRRSVERGTPSQLARGRRVHDLAQGSRRKESLLLTI